MRPPPELGAQIALFKAGYDAVEQDRIWAAQSATFRAFWEGRVMGPQQETLGDDLCDPVIRILDRNAKGNTKSSHAVARAMVPQGAWRRILNRLHADRRLGDALDAVLAETVPERKAQAIDRLYELNQGERNYLTGSSGNTVCAFLAAYDPVHNLSVISLRDRRAILEYLEVALPFDWGSASIGVQIVETNHAIQMAVHELGLSGSARTMSRLFYVPAVKVLWRGEHTVQLDGRSVSVAVPTEAEDDEVAVCADAALAGPGVDAPGRSAPADEIRESMQIQALLARIGAMMGFSIWLPKGDRSRVLKAWTPGPGELLDVLPLGYDATTTKTIEQIDVLWLRRRSIARAFEVEHTTSIYSGLLRMADLVALQPDIKVKLHIVAGIERQAKVLEEIKRPVFAMLERKPLREMCTFLSYDHIREIAETKFLAHLSDLVLDDYAVATETGDDEP
ncbi:hypothetical protein CKO44_05820 [Rubrivivax gelatinosus]|uniref:hypothetical protein n=1 Tax=Rubrivivax gelatinosus TaxID=28068 RepID=UPI0019037CE9|nr:hypothetical protein [Rubrivivax gelatinosus]MBK1612989.1 hypothetical protein [Rubrivivax gelatinosus]MBZ8143388.1 hypothetical protein [Rubrivivax gelatinosus]